MMVVQETGATRFVQASKRQLISYSEIVNIFILRYFLRVELIRIKVIVKTNNLLVLNGC